AGLMEQGMAKSGMATGPVTGRRPLLRWLLAATLLPGLALMLGACGTSAPVRYYTLAPVAAGVPQGATPAGSLTLIVGPIELPAYVGRPQLAVRTGEGQLEFS